MPPPVNRIAVAVTAAGVVSPLGCGLDETLSSLQAARDCISPVTQFDVSQCKSSTAGQVDEHKLASVGTRQEKRLHKASRMMIAAMRELIAQDEKFSPEMMVIGTTSGGMSFGEAFYRSILQHDTRRKHPTLLANYNAQKSVLDAQQAGDFSVPSQIIANACASGTNAIGHAFSLVQSGKFRRVLCGGFDAICELVFVGFDALQASTREKCRPFDKDRTGLALGEGAALLALENYDDAKKRGASILAKVTGYGISTDNHHLTQPHPSGIGPRQAMERALHSAGRAANEVDYINAHGTATLFNDATEGIAISQMFEGTPVSSTKSMMGHSLGAAGAIEAVICILALQHQFAPANINFRAADPTLNLNVIANETRPAKLECVISNSFGFGGTNATIVLEKA